MREVLRKADQLYRDIDCCHEDGRVCRCYDCLSDNWYRADTPDVYDCVKKLCYYVMNYGPAYASEIYHYLSQSEILENHFEEGEVNVLSLGCGFSPDLLALNRYVSEQGLTINVRYQGIDSERRWGEVRIRTRGARYALQDALEDVDLSDYDLVFVMKLFSTLKKNGHSREFLDMLCDQIDASLPDGSFIIFNDINLQSKGRDAFDTRIRRHMGNRACYYFPIDGAYTGDYTPINRIRNVFDIPARIAVTPKPDVTKAVIFEYRK